MTFKNNIIKILAFLTIFLLLLTLLINITFLSFSKDFQKNDKKRINYIDENPKKITLAGEVPESNKPENINSEDLKEENNTNQINTEPDYTKLYPNLYCQRPKKQTNPNKTIFLTFDDGPSERTTEILNILKEKNIKATFFVIGNNSKQAKLLMKRIVNEGHTIGIHTYSHIFKKIYASIPNYLEDFNNIYNLIYETTGVKPTIFRFPGGSKNNFNKNNYRELIKEMTRRGFDYFDWNLSVGDAVSRTPTPVEVCVNNVIKSSKMRPHGVVLMHDSKPKYTTVKALPQIIDNLIKQGFSFDKLSNEINPEPYSLSNPYK